MTFIAPFNNIKKKDFHYMGNVTLCVFKTSFIFPLRMMMSLLITFYYLEIVILSFPWRQRGVWILYISFYIEMYIVILYTYLNKSLLQP